MLKSLVLLSLFLLADCVPATPADDQARPSLAAASPIPALGATPAGTESLSDDEVLARIAAAVARGNDGLFALSIALTQAADLVRESGDEALLVGALSFYEEIFQYDTSFYHVSMFLPVLVERGSLLLRALEQALGEEDRSLFMDNLYIGARLGECGNDPLPGCEAEFDREWRRMHPERF